jgi:tripeptidyl-peptidase I
MPPGVGSLPEDVQGCGVNITPPCWKALYKLPEVSPPVTSANSLGLFEQGDYFAISDVQSYLELFAPYVPIDHLPIPALIDGAEYSAPANNTLLVGGEANIDIDIA